MTGSGDGEGLGSLPAE